jgi:hypothetical protein
MREIPYKVIDYNNYSNIKEANYMVEEKEKTYDIIINRGEKASAGFDLKIKKIIQKKNEISIYIEFFDPSPGEFVNQLITFPRLKIRLFKRDLILYPDIFFLFKDIEGRVLANK